MDREKVIERIHEAIDMGVCVDLFMDILALLKEQGKQKFFVDAEGKITPLPIVFPNCPLKEQEAVKPKGKVRHGANAQIQHFCGNCNSMLHGKPKFCSECGKGVLW